MIKINIFYDELDKVVGFQAEGHAMGPDRAEKYDLICCAVSTLTITTVNGITDLVHIQPEVLSVEDGWLKCILPLWNGRELSGEEQIKQAQTHALLDSMVLGLDSLAQDHPKFVQVKKRRWTS